MSNPNFSAVYSTNNIWRDTDMERCLTDDLDAMDTDIAALEAGKADNNHTHDQYAAANHEHTGYIPATESVATNISVTRSTAITLANTEDTTNWAAQVLYYPLLEMCFMRIFCTTSETLNADTSYVIGMLADANYAPENTMPLAVSCGKEIEAYIGPSGNIYVKPYENVYGSVPIRIGGFWFRPSLTNE